MTDIPGLSPEVENLIQSQWLGSMQQEIGVLKTNHMLSELRCSALLKQNQFDKELIKSLTERSLRAEEIARNLQKQLSEEINSRVTVKRKSKVKP